MKGWLVIATVFLVSAAGAIDTVNRFRSPRNPERKVRSSTELIVLHTTEAPARSSINKVSERGECHFVVAESGLVYRIVDLHREAFHAGRSMWGGKEDVDKFSVGIECVGYHNRPMPLAQLNSLRTLVKELQAKYRIPDERVVAHSHVAYGAPNRWQRYRHRGRKRCGMLFAMASVRRQLGLVRRPAFDPDTRAHRLTIGDTYLNKVLYGRIDTMAAKYGAPPAQVSAPAAKPSPQRQRAAIKTVQDLKAAGYRPKGTVSKNQTAIKIAGSQWNAADTYYVIRNRVISGSAIDAKHMQAGMVIWMRK